MRALAIVVSLCTTNVVLGWYFGYHAVAAYCVCWLLAAGTIVTAHTIVSRTFAGATPLDAAVRTALAGFAIVVLCGLVLGATRQLTLAGFASLAIALLGASYLLPAVPQPIRPTESAKEIPVWVLGILGALVSVAVAYAIAHAPLTLYDSISYHLFFSARWLQEKALSIVPTPFSDEAQAYAPANGELYFLWLMLPFHGDLLARFGQFPFALIGAALLFAIARRLGAPDGHAIYPAAFFLLSRPVLEQAIGADVDLICAAMFLAVIDLGLVAIDRGGRRDWIACGVALGLYWGTKYVALVYTPILLLFLLMRRPGLTALWALPGIVVFALPWYLRNWIVAGSPIYPASLQIAGVTIARGAFSRGAMLNSVFHTTDVRLLPAMLAHAFGPTLYLLWIPAVVVGGIGLLRRGWWPHGFLLVMPFLMLPLYWFGLPVNVDSRFLLAAIGPALLPFAFVFRPGRRAWNASVHAVALIGMLWILIGSRAAMPDTLPWFMNGWLALTGLVHPTFVIAFLVIAAAMTLAWFAWRLVPLGPRWAIPFATCLLAGTTTALAIGGERWCAPERCSYLETTSPYVRLGLVHAWRWVDANIRGATIAYTGINLPYPLTGVRLANRVVYANIDGRPRWRFHDYDRAYREGRFTPSPPALAIPSGELLPVRQRPGPHTDAVRPRYERLQGIRGAWIANLEQLRVDYVFVAALSAYELDYQWHNDRGFPIEDQWASQDPDRFHSVFENDHVRIYAVDRREASQ